MKAAILIALWGFLFASTLPENAPPPHSTDLLTSGTISSTNIFATEDLEVITIGVNVSCNGLSDGSATANASGGTGSYSYNWSTGGATSTIDNLVAGTYTVTVSDGMNEVVESVAITQPAALGVFIKFSPACSGLNDGSVEAVVSGGTPNYSFLWSNGETTSEISGLPPGLYSVTVTDANGCTASASGALVSQTCSRSNDSLELVRFYNSTGGPNWTSTWNLNQPMNTWLGVTLDGNGFVLNLELSDNNLTGTLPDLNLPRLVALNLNGSEISGAIPDFSGLPSLQAIGLNHNLLSGPIPDFSNLPNLIELVITGNPIGGQLPNFSNLPALQILELIDNQIEGPLPDLVNLANLIYFRIAENQVTGSIPEFPTLSKLETLDLSNNQLSGTIPNFSGMPSLTILNLNINQLTGNIPDFSNLPVLDLLTLNLNQLTGGIPDFSNLPLLTKLNLRGNQLSGPLVDFSNLPLLSELVLQINKLEGPVLDFQNLPNLQVLDLGGNLLTGIIPDFSNLPLVTFLRLDYNQLTGSIPSFSNLPKLEYILLEEMKLEGTIPNFPNQPDLFVFNAGSNNLDSIARFTNKPKLVQLVIQGNRLTFEDVLQNIDLPSLTDYFYDSQQEITLPCTTVSTALGSDLVINLSIDEGVTSNVYQWFKDDLPYLTIQGKNFLTLYDLEAADAGTYRCEVSNPLVPGLILFSQAVVVQTGGNQNFRLLASNVYGAAGDTICVDIRTQGFTDILATDYSVNWDTTDLRLINILNVALPGGDAGDFNLTQSAAGRLGLNWTAPGNAVTLPNNSRLFQLCFKVKDVNCRNSKIGFGRTPVDFNVESGSGSCIFFDGRPGLFTSDCVQELELPEQSEYEAQVEYTDTTGWTTYIKPADIPKNFDEDPTPDTLLLGINKNGQDIGTVGDGRFMVEVTKDTGTVDFTAMVQEVPGYEDISQARALNYFWSVEPNYSSIKLDTVLGLRFYFTAQDSMNLEKAMGIEDLRYEDVFFFKMSEPDTTGESEFQLFRIGGSTSDSTWVFAPITSFSRVGTMDISGFSQGGILAMDRTTPVREIEAIERLAIYPNPASERLRIDIDLTRNDELVFQLFDGLGRAVLHQRLSAINGQNSMELDLSNLRSGIYYLQIRDLSGRITSRKVGVVE